MGTKTVDQSSIVEELAQEYLQRYARAPYKRASSARNDRSMLKRIILPRFGEMRVEAVGRRQIEDLRDELSATKYQANRVLSLLSRLFTLAEQWDSETDRNRPPLRNPVRSVMFRLTWIKPTSATLRRKPPGESRGGAVQDVSLQESPESKHTSARTSGHPASQHVSGRAP
jgi:hypothetical protein